MTSSYEAVLGLLVDLDGQVLRLTFDRAERRNALDDEVAGGDDDAIDAAGRDEGVRRGGAHQRATSARGSTSWPATPRAAPGPGRQHPAAAPVAQPA